MKVADVHVLPMNDLREHEETRECWCQPRLEANPHRNNVIVVHHALDGRDLIEQHGIN